MAALAPIFGGPAIQKKTSKRDNIPWVEKYRPSKVGDVAYQKEVVAALSKCLSGEDLPHMLFYGPPGTGKTTSAVAICRQLFNTPEAYEDRVLELNASDERGINVVRTKIKQKAQHRVSTSATKQCAASVKVIILDEADAMTSAAQMALRRIMETESRTTRFFIICNYISRIIAPLASRCVKFRFKPLPGDAQLERLRYICKAENVKITDVALQNLVNFSDGDLRKSITRLQSLSLGCCEINAADVAECCGQVPDEVVQKLLRSFHLKVKDVIDEVNDIVLGGYSGSQLIHQLSPYLVKDENLKPISLAKILDVMGLTEERLTNGGNCSIELTHLGIYIHNCLREQL